MCVLFNIHSFQKCYTRDCYAFLYRSLPGDNGDNAGGNLCILYDECDLVDGRFGKPFFLFFPIAIGRGYFPTAMAGLPVCPSVPTSILLTTTVTSMT